MRSNAVENIEKCDILSLTRGSDYLKEFLYTADYIKDIRHNMCLFMSYLRKSRQFVKED